MGLHSYRIDVMGMVCLTSSTHVLKEMNTPFPIIQNDLSFPWEWLGGYGFHLV